MNVTEYLSGEGVCFEVHEHPPAYTAQEVAAREHVSGNLLAKAVLVKARRGAALCVLPASYKLDMKKVAKAMGVRKVSLADEKELAEAFPDVEVGAEPPFGNLYDLPTLVDEHLAGDEQIVFQAGDHRHAVSMNYADYARLVEPTVADLAVHL
jgi:Ala-tRNA(Pro) deacylase